MEDASAGESATLELVFFSAKASLLRVIDNPNGASDLAQAMPANECLAGVNGGYFDPNFAPLGLRIIDGKMVQPVVRARLMTGFLLSSRENTQILRVGEYSARRKAYSAVQCGPLLVDGAQPVKGWIARGWRSDFRRGGSRSRRPRILLGSFTGAAFANFERGTAGRGFLKSIARSISMADPRAHSGLNGAKAVRFPSQNTKPCATLSGSFPNRMNRGWRGFLG